MHPLRNPDLCDKTRFDLLEVAGGEVGFDFIRDFAAAFFVEFYGALGAITVAEGGFGVSAEVGIDLAPVTGVVANALAVTTDGEKAFEGFDLIEGGTEGSVGAGGLGGLVGVVLGVEGDCAEEESAEDARAEDHEREGGLEAGGEGGGGPHAERPCDAAKFDVLLCEQVLADRGGIGVALIEDAAAFGNGDGLARGDGGGEETLERELRLEEGAEVTTVLAIQGDGDENGEAGDAVGEGKGAGNDGLVLAGGLFHGGLAMRVEGEIGEAGGFTGGRDNPADATGGVDPLKGLDVCEIVDVTGGIGFPYGLSGSTGYLPYPGHAGQRTDACFHTKFELDLCALRAGADGLGDVLGLPGLEGEVEKEGAGKEGEGEGKGQPARGGRRAGAPMKRKGTHED
jgi:hypothetical protein